MKKLLYGIAVSCMFCAMFLACAKKAPGADDGKIHLTLWHSYVGADQRAEFMKRRLEQFREANPGIVIEEQGIPRDQYQTRLKTQAAAQELPNAFVSWPNTPVREFVEAGLLADIGSLLEREKSWADSILPIAKDEFTVNGKTYGVGLGISVTSVFFYNKALFQKYNVKVPETYDELKTAVNVFKKNNIIPIALGNKAKWPAQSEIFSIVGNRVTGSQWLNSALAGNGAKFTDKIFIDALSIMKELADMEAFNRDYNSVDDVQVRGYFYREEAAMMINGTWVIPDIAANVSVEMKEKIEMTVFPAIAGGAGEAGALSGVSSTSIVCNAKNTPEQKEAVENLILFLTNEDAQKMYMEYYIPVSSKNVEFDLSSTDPIYAKLVTLMKEHPDMVTVYDSALNSEQTEIINNGLQGIMLGTETPAQVAQSLAATVK
ncbi:MAG: extracellular solute-binding protein [Spirochaetaceae bacterium]|jgi:raffinose/stachyose/melibiose transport system substrate-binding protein|nr:extracellular solute-binding protein [Spirochaetaceae bacterium]